MRTKIFLITALIVIASVPVFAQLEDAILDRPEEQTTRSKTDFSQRQNQIFNASTTLTTSDVIHITTSEKNTKEITDRLDTIIRLLRNK